MNYYPLKHILNKTINHNHNSKLNQIDVPFIISRIKAKLFVLDIIRYIVNTFFI